MEVINTHPLGDLHEHRTDGADGRLCWCRPRVIEAFGGMNIVHNSADGREAFETGERKPS